MKDGVKILFVFVLALALIITLGVFLTGNSIFWFLEDNGIEEIPQDGSLGLIDDVITGDGEEIQGF